MTGNLDKPVAQSGSFPASVPTVLTDEFRSIRVAAPHHASGRLRVALVGTYAPRNCGIATFTTDVCQQLTSHFREVAVDVYALEAEGAGLAYPEEVRLVRADCRESYAETARAINRSGADVVWIQHEFGIYGGEDGAFVKDLVNGVAAPVVITFHTVLATPTPGQRAIMEHLLCRCSRIMVMSQQSRELLVSVYAARADIIEIIEHGAPDRPFGTAEQAKKRMGLAGKRVLTTFGLLGPGKGLDVAIAALPAILERHPDVVYRILGATHPVTAAREGEAYRESLEALARRLGVSDSIQWENRFLAIDELLSQLECCDIYLTPYRSLAQTTSGTLSYAVALGKAVVSTPYIHARELLADGVGCLIEPDSPEAIADAVNALLSSSSRLLTIQQRAYERGRRTIWPRFAHASLHLLRNTQACRKPRAVDSAVPSPAAVWTMSDATGMFQHAIGTIPDRRHGYCIDDNARALMLMNVAGGAASVDRLRWSSTYASFMQFAWNPDEQRFRNFMAYNRDWCESAGSQDSNGRAFWALGHTVESSPFRDLRIWAKGLFHCAIPALEAMQTPRAMAFAALGCCALLRAGEKNAAAEDCVVRTCETLAHLVERHRRPAWVWFETMLGYDNPRLCQALIEGGLLSGRQDWLDTGLETLHWITCLQTTGNGHFRPVGSESFGREGESLPFDQQPLEAHAAIDAARVAWLATRNPDWIRHADQAYQWFFGANDRGVPLADTDTGHCRDGVTPRGRNENCGAESILAFQLAHYSLKALKHSDSRHVMTSHPMPSPAEPQARLG